MDEFLRTFLVIFFTVLIAAAIGYSFGYRSSTPATATADHAAAIPINGADYEALLNLLRECDRLIWMIVKEAGGKVAVSVATEATYSPTLARMVYGRDPDGGTTVEIIDVDKAFT